MLKPLLSLSGVNKDSKYRTSAHKIVVLVLLTTSQYHTM